MASGLYTGQKLGPIPHGTGTYVFKNKFFKFQGDWVEGKKHGHGILFFKDGGSYEGEFRDDEIMGQGVRRWSDGSTYTGEFVRGERSGKGYLRWICINLILSSVNTSVVTAHITAGSGATGSGMVCLAPRCHRALVDPSV